MTTIEHPPARRITHEAEAIDIARQVASEIAALAADPGNNRPLPRRQAELLSSSGLTAIGVPTQFGGLGASVSLRDVPCDDDAAHDAALLFSESPSRFLLEVRPGHAAALNDLFDGLPLGRLGEVVRGDDEPEPSPPRLTVRGLNASPVIEVSVTDLKSAWQRPLRW